MVMHARKIPRVSDGYFEKHHTNSYQDNSKYDSKGICIERNNSERNSPNGNNVILSDSSDCADDLSKDYTYSNKAYYLQKLQEKEKEPRNERDKFNNSRDKYTEHLRSPNDSKKNLNRDPRENLYRTNHDRNMTEDLPNNHKVPIHRMEVNQRKNPSFGISSQESDKREIKEKIHKVGDWTEHKSSSGKLYYFNFKKEVSQWEKPKEWLEKEGVTALFRPHHSSYKPPYDKHSNMRLNSVNSNAVKESVPQPVPHPYSQLKQKYPTWNKMNNCTDSRNQENCIVTSNEMQSSSQDMEICSGSSTPTSENLSTHEQTSIVGDSGPILSGPGTPLIKIEVKNDPLNVLNSCGKSTIITATTTTSSSQNASPIIDRLYNNSITTSSSKLDTDIPFDRITPPTPTHSENHHDIEESKKSSPRSDSSTIVDIPKPVCSIISPSYANNVKHELTNHVLDWPAVPVEKQISKLADEMRSAVHLQIPKLELELSLVRGKVRSSETHVVRLEHKFLHLEELKTIEAPRKYSMYNGEEEMEEKVTTTINENSSKTDDDNTTATTTMMTMKENNDENNERVASQIMTVTNDDENIIKKRNNELNTPDNNDYT